MNLIERATVMHYHRHRIAEFGPRPQALGWKAPHSQWERFELIAQAADFAHCSVLDVGCGRGDLKDFLDERHPGVRYTGVDQMPELLDDAVRRHGASARFLLGDFGQMELPAADYVIASGALSYRCAEEGWHLRMVRKMHAAARRALIFNVLDARRFPDHPLLVGHDCAEVLDLCRRLSPHVAASQGELDDDMTFIVPATE
ncbi:class I SAM-dependent methyltransferase [Ramlibacter sp.]|uniref:class I SAM-dependent methyltransferase n=1 Tax=Ramlibacter sp. TaxID=1917967 RepID=UPI001834E081|nr:class I SAM-dependent methyltransferase [Ramlibacter sp.]MBA2675654.1 class I SAM-dependent methyltransferase [Ramlibacter sp.]